LKEIIIANARYWLDYLDAISEDTLISDAAVRGVAKALDTAVTVPEAWSLTQALALLLHPHMERRGYWTDWGSFLQILITHAHQRADVATEAELLIRCGAVQRQRGDYRAALHSYRRAWWLCRRSGDELGRAIALSNLGDLYRLQERFRRAEVLCQGALALFEALEDSERLAYTENHLGLIYFAQRRWSEALAHFTRSKTLQEQIGDRHGLAKTLQNLGVLYRRVGNLEGALAFFGQAIQHYQEVGDEAYAARTQANVGTVYLNQSDLLRAERAYNRAETVLKRVGDSLDLARVRHNLGILYTRLENWTEAQACFERALEQWRNLGDERNLANTLGELANLHLSHGHWDQAQACLDEAWELVGERQETHYRSLQSELKEMQQKLHHLARCGTTRPAYGQNTS
jgi:tetratricopeptide (TPR) repeat protein